MWTNSRSCKVLALAFSSLMSLSSPAHADVGDLDPTFGFGGRVTTDISGDRDEANALAIQSDGKIIVAGVANGDFAVARYNANGTLDPSFGNDGKAVTDFGGGADTAYAVVIQSNGKIVVAGSSRGAATPGFALARHNTDGTLDTTFGIGGKITTDFGRDARVKVLAIQPDGKIVAVGTIGTYLDRDFAVSRYDADGMPDTIFGNNGKVITDFFGEGDRAFAAAIQPDGRIVAAGTAGNFPRAEFALARYNTDGTFDESFGTGGKLTTDLGSDETVRAVTIQSDGKILAEGFVNTGSGDDLGLAQYNSDGTLDTDFGRNGKVRTSFGSHNYGGPIATQPDGKIVVAGFDDLGPTYDFVLGRFNADGTMDTTFGTKGTVLTPFGGDNWINAVAIQSDGKIVAVGYADVPSGDDFALARYDSGLPFVSEITLDPPTVPVGTSFTATFSGTNLSDETYFDIRFRAPGSRTDDVILNWKQGQSAVHAIQSGTATGAWKLTGVRAHQEIDKHGGDFVSVSATLTVTPSR